MSDEDAEVCCDSEEKAWCGTGHRTAQLHLSETGLRTDFETGCDAFATPHAELGSAHDRTSCSEISFPLGASASNAQPAWKDRLGYRFLSSQDSPSAAVLGRIGPTLATIPLIRIRLRGTLKQTLSADLRI